MVDTGLKLACGIVARVEVGHAEGEDPLDDALRQVTADEDAHPLAEVILGEGDEGGEDFLAEQHDGDDGDNADGLLTPVDACRDQTIDFVDGPIEHDGIDLCHQGANQGKY